jgi:hypothetical protein
MTNTDEDVKAEREVRQILRAALAGKDRTAVARTMTELLGHEVYKTTLDGFVRTPTENRVIRFPLAWAPAFCRATGDDELQRWFLRQSFGGFAAFRQRLRKTRTAVEATLRELEKVSDGES